LNGVGGEEMVADARAGEE
jgi:hypothetical protein